MDLPMIDNSAAYVEVCKKAGLPINKVPKKGEQIELSYLMALKEYNPHLLQNITAPDPDDLPADVSQRYKAGTLWTDDIDALEKAGFYGTSSNMKAEMLKAQEMIEQNKLKEMAARNKAREEAIRNKPVGFHPTKNIDFNSPEAQKARREWGVSDDIGLGR